MKAKVAVSLVVFVGVVIVAVLVANWYVGNRIEKAISMAIYEQMRSGHIPLTINYDEISVNPLLRTAKLDDLSLVEQETGTRLSAGSMKISCKLTDLIAVAREEKVDELHGFKLDLKDISVRTTGRDDYFSAGAVSLHVDGLISGKQFSGAPADILQDERRVALIVKNADIPVLGREMPVVSCRSSQQIAQVDLFSADLEYDPGDETLKLESLKLETPLVELWARGELMLAHAIAGRPSAERLIAGTKLTSEPNKCTVSLPLSGVSEKMSVGKIELQAQIDHRFSPRDRTPIPEGEIEFQVKDLALDLSRDAKRALGLDRLDNFIADEIQISVDCRDGVLKITDTTMKSPDVNIDGELTLGLNNRDLDDSTINEARLHIKNISSDLIPAVIATERELGYRILKNDEIKLEWVGTLGNPRMNAR